MLRVEKLNYEVKGRKLLKDVSFHVRKGEVLTLLGANGAGKSTLMKVLCGEYKPNAGLITLHGKALDAYDPRVLARHRAMLSQQQHVALAFTVEEIVMMGRYPHFKNRPAARDLAVVAEVMAICGVEEFAKRVFTQLSGGEQQRVQLARSLAQVWDNPSSLLLLDEPISALDMHYQQKVLAIAKALSRRGFIVVLVVHDVNFAATYADRIVMLKHGRKLFDGSPIEVLTAHNIYTVFSVASVVELNPRTLRPYIRLEEMPIDIYAFNNHLPNDAGETRTLRQQQAQLLAANPYLDYVEQARQLAVSHAEIWLMDPRKQLFLLTKPLADLYPLLTALGEVLVYTQNSCCVQKQTKCYQLQSNNAARVNSTPFIYAIASGHTVAILDRSTEQGIHFFDRNGNVLHGVYLVDHSSNPDAFAAIADDASNIKAASRFFQQLEPVVVGEKEATLADEKQHMVGLQQFKRVLAQCVSSGLILQLSIVNSSFKQVYEGRISHLVDQGTRYIIKEKGFELLIQMELLDKIYLRRETGADANEANVTMALFDQNGNPVLEVTSLLPAQQRQWQQLFAVEIII
ncbi:heme ABC transporter ATP-binding protein [Sphingobacterium oryzagri]|uniref:Heme ABC transporter ATP-binding protein n=1 Tax=Sphingobacterium oryzagri TaxID=3025669 RepID=A0ABY7WMD8_9SPHI|nr:heme ABC transporter ATP-binding protein [Sphingobacterium sp. KACC 22765]WDF70771.1 heme ABC transporter ATP-binding protein [Sphingobacterium sp. KACC 22765]